MSAIGVVAVILLIALFLICLCEWSYQRGFRDGSSKVPPADWEWWAEMEREVDEERQKIWREEGWAKPRQAANRAPQIYTCRDFQNRVT